MLPAVTTLDLAAGIALSPIGIGMPLALTLRVDNLTDRQYQEVFNFAAPGRRILVGGKIDAMLR